jgi:TRAP-type C4-dicarboxylate transport system permease small subunit
VTTIAQPVARKTGDVGGNVLKGLLSGLGAAEKIGSFIGAVFMFAIMIVVFGDVVMRYVFNSPFSWAYDLIALYLMAGVFFLVLSEAYTSNAHVSVDILQQRLPPAGIRMSELVTCVVGVAVFALITWLGWQRAVESYYAADVMAGAIPWPMWPSLGLVPLGAGLLTLRLALHFAGHLLSLVTGRDFIPLPASHASSEVETFE